MSQITLEQFENLLNMSESSTLDFKRQMYDFDNDPNDEKLAKFIKDIISFCNTIRTQSSHIIVGVEEKADGAKDIVGLDRTIDDSILQAKVKGKMFPQADFKYYTYQYQNNTFGIFEFPITKYETPITPSVKLKGLQVGMAYFRNGSSNTEAYSQELIRISDWLRGLKASSSNKSNSEKIALLLKNAVNNENKLSELITEALLLSKELDLNDLKEFCANEITGYKNLMDDGALEQYRFRSYKTCFSIGTFDSIRGSVTQEYIVNYLKENKNYYEVPLLYSFPITEIEHHMSHTIDNKGFYRQNSTIKKVLPDLEIEDREITYYMFYESFQAIHNNIRQKLIELLIAL